MQAPVDAEKSVIGLLLLFPAETEAAYTTLRPRMFSQEPLALCFSGCMRLRRAGAAPDPVLLISKLGEGYRQLVLECCETAPSLGGLAGYIAIVLDAWRERTITAKLTELAISGQTADELTAALMNLVQDQQRIVQHVQRSTVKTYSQGLVELLGELHKPDSSIRTGWHSFDALTGGLLPGTVTVVAARPGKGKTDFALQMATQISKRRQVLYQSMEMPVVQLQQRILSRACKINSARFRDKDLSEAEWATVAARTDQMRAALHLVIDEATGADLAAVEANIRAYKPEVAFVDHLGLMKTEKRMKRNEELAELTRGIKELALRLDKPIVELVQAGRAADGKRMTMADMFGSATIEQDADMLIGLEPEAAEGRILSGEQYLEVEARVLKNRHGGTGTLRFIWKPQYHDYTEMEMRY